jgi:DNA-binding NarL/FixJ family response regulator
MEQIMIQFKSNINEFIKLNYLELELLYYKVAKYTERDKDSYHDFIIYLGDHDILEKFNVSKGNFINYLHTWIRGFLSSIREKVNYDIYNNLSEYNDEVDYSGVLQDELDDRIDFKDKRLNEIADGVRQGLRETQIASNLNISKQRVHQIIKKNMKIVAQDYI